MTWVLKKFMTLKEELLDTNEMKKIFIFFGFIFLFVGCKKSINPINQKLVVVNATHNAEHPGKKLMEINCYACHNPITSHEDRIAPPMIAIKKHYLSGNTTKEQFIADIQNWIEKPSETKSKMPGAIRNFGIMPYAPFPEKTITQIADYMFDFNIDQPEWFEDHFNEERGKGMGKGMGQGLGQGRGMGQGMKLGQSNNEDLDHEEIGLKYALSTKAQLGKNLMGALQKNGVKDAVTFCNERAYTLTDSMAKIHRANIKRVSDKPRNQNNKANDIELKHIDAFKKLLANQEEIKPIIEEANNSINFYYPITTNTMCLQCHGSLNNEIESKTYKTIKKLYPKDKAIGYNVNEVRGIWSIQFEK